MKNSNFRYWLEQMWRENRSEREFFNEQPQSLTEYFNKYKYWLKREFKYQRDKNELR